MIHPSNWHPFAPNGWPGILTGGSIIFFTYIGFDSVSTAAEECKDPKRDVPIGIIATLVVCTILYIGVVVVLTGLVPWQSLMDDAAPVVNTLKRLGMGNIQLIVLIGALLGMISSLLVFQLGQARVWFAMSRDGLLPRIFGRVHPQVSHAGFFDDRRGISGWNSGGVAGHRNARGPFEYRHAVCVRAGGRRRVDSALQAAGPAARIPCSRWYSGTGDYDSGVFAADGRITDHQLDPIFRLAADWALFLLRVRAQAQPAFRCEYRSGPGQADCRA